VDADALLLDANTRLFTTEDRLSFEDWLDEVYANERKLDHPLLPLVYPKRK
jgi:hypothetical protein